MSGSDNRADVDAICVTGRADRSRPTNQLVLWLSGVVQDALIAVRTFARQPTLAIVPVLSSALGIAACTLIIGIANFAMLRPLPVSEGLRLISISSRNLRTGDIGDAISYPDYRDLIVARSFEATAAYFPMMPAALSDAGFETQRYWGTISTANYFEVVRPGFLFGRGFDARRDDAPGADPVIVLSHDLWVSRFGGDARIVGRTIVMNRRTVTVIGVTRPGFRGTDATIASDFWVPFSMRDLVVTALPKQNLGIFEDRDAHWLFVLGRLQKNLIVEQADAELQTIAERLSASYPATNKDRGFHVERAGQLVPAVRRAMLALFILLLAVSGLVLLTACANIANLLLARATARHKEIATRLAMGAGAGRLVRQLLTESILLSLMGGALGYVIAHYGARSFGRLHLPIGLPFDFSISLDYRVLLFSVALSFSTGVLFGLAPALHAVRQDLISGLKNQAQQAGPAQSRRVRNFLVISQVAISMLLLACAGLFFRSLQASKSTDTGMANRNVALIGFDPFLQGASIERERILTEVLRRVEEIPGVQSAALTSTVPLSLAGISGSISTEDRHDGDKLKADIYEVSSRFFDTLGIRFIAGDDFRPGKMADDVVILNEAAAERLFPGRHAIGSHVQSGDKRLLRVIGVVATSKSRTIAEQPRSCVYKPLLQGGEMSSITGLTLVLRTAGNPAAYLAGANAAVREVDPGIALFDIRTMDQHLADALMLRRAGAFMFGLAGLISIVIAGVGLYGVVSFLVARQTKDIGIRMALGAQRRQILAAVVRQGLGPAITGSAVGLGLAIILSNGIGGLLYGVSPTDPVILVAAPLFLLATALVACIVPALHAANVAPVVSIRHE